MTPQRPVRTQRLCGHRISLAPVAANRRRNAAKACHHAANTAMAHQPRNALEALAGRDSPEPARVAQVRQQRDVRDARRRHDRIRVPREIGVVKHPETAGAQDSSTTRMETKADVHLLIPYAAVNGT